MYFSEHAFNLKGCGVGGGGGGAMAFSETTYFGAAEQFFCDIFFLLQKQYSFRHKVLSQYFFMSISQMDGPSDELTSGYPEFRFVVFYCYLARSGQEEVQISPFSHLGYLKFTNTLSFTRSIYGNSPFHSISTSLYQYVPGLRLYRKLDTPMLTSGPFTLTTVYVKSNVKYIMRSSSYCEP